MIASSCLAQGLRVVSATPDSLAAAHGIGQGDRLISINNHPIRDLIDVRFYSACERARLEIASADIGCAKTGKSAPLRRVTIRKAFDGDLGIEVEPFRIRSCRNRCLFCFVRQQPKGLRAPLYVRDDDYRLSFLHGNYITGTNLDSEDLARIAEQRLAPLFLSVHAMDPLLRGRMLGLGRPAPIAPLMDFLSERRLAFQTQIVLCPGVNDGAALAQTLEALGGYYPHCESVAIVPAGLTRHREGLERLRRFTPRYARRLIESTMPLRKRLARHIGEDIVYLSDEIYFLAGEPLLDYSRRNYWRQIENGVGMVHEFYKNFRLARWPGLIRSSKLKSAGVFGSPEKFPRQAPLRIAFVTGGLGKIVLERLLESLNRIPGITAQALVARNTLFGDSVTVSGLLGGTDILRTIQRRLKEFDLFLLPPNCLRSEDHLFLDDLSLEQLRAQTGADVRIAYQNAQEILWEIKKM